ncbi:MAG TPA: sigma-54 dependent transcriptional regulator, partial [Candidatus Hydrogenedentes bacterium]|nr:sigma-54 dependent transcriptional regulator [Candidatus Hydrogenedentota bacterium]
MMEQRHRIAIVDDDPGQRQLLANALERAGYETLRCEDGPQGLAAAADASLMLLDVRMPGMSGLEVLERVKRDRPQLPVILLTAYIDVRDAVSAMKQGALDYLEKPVDLDELIAAVDDALGAIGRAVSQGEAPEIPRGIVAESDAMRRVFQQAARVASSEATVLLLGESGTGKEVVAEFIHQRSTRAERPLVRVNCGGLPANLIESELFGHEKGAFTGADAPHRGRFEEAHEGAIFLDEIGELPLAVQPTLLHVLENGAMRRVGGGRELTVDVRVIAATNRSLEDDVREGRFREDLFYRLNVFALEVPPLRERRDDILPLAAHFLKDEKRRLAPATERVLMAYDWPGNVRELRNAMERAGIMADGNLVLPKDLP